MKIANHETCCGCGNCALVCPGNAITIELDASGFYKRVIDENKCINCHLCEKVCVVETDAKQYTTSLGEKSFYSRTKSKELLKDVSSGGIASALAYMWLKAEASVVYGSRYADDFCSVKTVRIENANEISFLRGSKYVQSEKSDIFKILEDDLRNGRQVLYIGLPCDIAALKIFLKKEYTNLLTCELICHGVTSTHALNEYLAEINKKAKSDITSVNMRYKKNEMWCPYYFRVDLHNGKHIIRDFWKSAFGFAFSRYRNTACYECRFKGENRCADITIGDAWGADHSIIEKHKNGLSSVLLNSDKGIRIFDQLIRNDDVVVIETTREAVITGNPNLVRNDQKPKNYSEMDEIFRKRGLFCLEKKFRPFRSRLVIKLKRFLKRE